MRVYFFCSILALNILQLRNKLARGNRKIWLITTNMVEPTWLILTIFYE
jgi:hypothetical protein